MSLLTIVVNFIKYILFSMSKRKKPCVYIILYVLMNDNVLEKSWRRRVPTPKREEVRCVWAGGPRGSLLLRRIFGVLIIFCPEECDGGKCALRIYAVLYIGIIPCICVGVYKIFSRWYTFRT